MLRHHVMWSLIRAPPFPAFSASLALLFFSPLPLLACAEHALVEVKGFPTIKFSPANQKETLEEYVGENCLCMLPALSRLLP